MYEFLKIKKVYNSRYSILYKLNGEKYSIYRIFNGVGKRIKKKKMIILYENFHREIKLIFT